MADRARPETLIEQEANAMHDLLATNGLSAFVFVVTMGCDDGAGYPGTIARGYGKSARGQALAYADLLEREANRIREKVGARQ